MTDHENSGDDFGIAEDDALVFTNMQIDDFLEEFALLLGIKSSASHTQSLGEALPTTSCHLKILASEVHCRQISPGRGDKHHRLPYPRGGEFTEGEACQQKGKLFKKRFGVRYLQVQGSGTRLICKVCRKELNSRSELKKHSRTHTLSK
mmetsp:Transcript_3896/g.8169  ORF Transcript_3896/g.8169 Transcript_3896/m.8169 type:complete len:149 (+) Transcript_3896:13-459(+)